MLYILDILYKYINILFIYIMYIYIYMLNKKTFLKTVLVIF